jgi:4-hydroxybenzoate polyprenyltransferase
LWSNHFYGIAASLLAIESSMVILNQVPSFFLVAFIYIGTLVYYTYAYFNETSTGLYNERSNWYQSNKGYLKIRQFVLILLCISIGVFKLQLIEIFILLPIGLKLTLCIALVIILLYYYAHKIFKRVNLRNKGLLKSMSIAWVWVVVCFILPIVMQSQGKYNFSAHYALLHLLQLYLFILILAILFDIKDINRDNDENIKTLVAKYGIKPIMYTFILPLVLVYLWVSFFLFFRLNESFVYFLTPLLISLLILMVSYLVQKRKTIHENILLIDGLILIKALLGILLMLFAGNRLCLNYTNLY